MTSSDPSERRSPRRSWALAALVILSVIIYLAVVLLFDLTARPSERVFGEQSDAAPRVRIYVEPLSAAPVDEAMEMRIHVAPGAALRGNRASTPNRDLSMILTTGETVEERVFRAYEPMTPLTIRPNLNDGNIIRYPFDRYRVALRIQTFEGVVTATESGRPMPEEVTVWQGLPGYRVRADQASANAQGDISVRLDLRRADAYIFFALAAYAAMAVVACCSLAISSLVFLGRRRVESTLMGALGALVFALPVMRGIVPGTPPLGVWADLVIFLWAELASVIGLALFVFSWASQRADP
ncbi:MAG: DUF4436 family protein [Acetobacteraceae bacterium]